MRLAGRPTDKLASSPRLIEAVILASSAMARRLSNRAAARIACVAAALAIAGCAAPTPSTQAAGAPATQGARASPSPATPSDIAPAVATPQPAAPSTGAPAASPQPAPPETVAQAPSITQLIGLSAGQLQQRLGPAGFVRRDGAAEIWRYSVDDCHVDLFLYREESGPRVQHIEARPRSGGRINARRCYERLLAMRRVSAAG